MCRRRAAIGLGLALLAGALLAAQEALVYLRPADPLTLDPGKFEDFYSQEVIANVFEGLVRLRPGTLTVEPCLAERWSASDGATRWRFVVRRGVRFQDGRECNAHAVVYSFRKRLENRGGEFSAFAHLFSYITAVRALDDWSVEFTLARPHGGFLLSLTDARAAIVAPGAYDGPDFRPVGTGPYAVADWTRSGPLELKRHPRYWDSPARIETVIIKSESSPIRRVSQLKAGGAQVVSIRSAAEYGELQGREDIGVLSQPSFSTGYLGFNCQRPPCRLLPVRSALAHLINRNILVRRVFQNLAEPALSFLPPQMDRSPAANRDDFNPQKAQRLLNQAGLAKGISCTLYYTEGQFGIEEMVEAIAATALRVNIRIQGVKLPFSQFIQAIRNGEPDMFLVSWGYTADPGIFLNPMFMLAPGGGKMMSAGPEYASLLAEAEASGDPRKREACWARAQQLLQRELPLLPLFHLNKLTAFNRRVGGLRFDTLGFLLLKEARLESR